MVGSYGFGGGVQWSGYRVSGVEFSGRVIGLRGVGLGGRVGKRHRDASRLSAARRHPLWMDPSKEGTLSPINVTY